MADVSSGIKSKAAFRINRRSSTLDYPVTEAEANLTRKDDSEDERIGAYDKIPLVTEDVTQERTLDPSAVLEAKTGVAALDEVAIGASGRSSLEGHYLGIGQILAAAMGFEKVRIPAALESPSCEGSASGDRTSTGTVQAINFDRISIVDPNFVEANEGEWIRVTKKDATQAGINQVRRILTYVNATAVDCTPNFTTAFTSWTVEWGLVWKHTYECAIDLHEDTFTSLFGANVRVYPASDLMVRRGCFVVDKQVARHAANSCMVNRLRLKLTNKGLDIEANLVPFAIYRQTAAAGENLNPAYWLYSGSSLAINERILLSDAVFRFGDYSADTGLGNDNKLSIADFELVLNNNLIADDKGTGSTKYILEPVRNGVRNWTGYFVVPRFTAEGRYVDFEASTIKMADLVFTGNSELLSESSLYNELSIFLRSLKITSVKTHTSGPGIRRERVDFQCIEPTADPKDMPATTTGAANSEVIIQLQNNDPFNAFMDQNEEDPY